LGLLVVAGCAADKVGSGDETSDIPEVDPFSRIVMGAEVEVVVAIGDEQQVTVRGDENLGGDIDTAVEGDTLSRRCRLRRASRSSRHRRGLVARQCSSACH
jgi:hypothetical protein